MGGSINHEKLLPIHGNIAKNVRLLTNNRISGTGLARYSTCLFWNKLCLCGYKINTAQHSVVCLSVLSRNNVSGNWLSENALLKEFLPL